MTNVSKALKLYDPDGVKFIRQSLEEDQVVSRLTDSEIEKLWRAYSLELRAGWLTVNEDTVDAFKDWIQR